MLKQSKRHMEVSERIWQQQQFKSAAFSSMMYRMHNIPLIELEKQKEIKIKIRAGPKIIIGGGASCAVGALPEGTRFTKRSNACLLYTSRCV